MKKVIVTKLSRAIRHVVSRGAQGPRGGIWAGWADIPDKPDFDTLYDPLGAASTAQSAAAEDATAKVNAHTSAPDPHPQYALDTDLSGHAGNTSNPHSVTKAQVGLGNVDNTSDASKPVSTAQQNALNAKEPTIAAGTSAQYWRGDKSWADFAASVRAVALTALSTASASVITAADSVLGAIGKLQAQISDVITQTEAETGTSTTRRSWTSQRVRQATAAWWLTASSALGRTLASVADAAAGRTALGLGSASVLVAGQADAALPTNSDLRAYYGVKYKPAVAPTLVIDFENSYFAIYNASTNSLFVADTWDAFATYLGADLTISRAGEQTYFDALGRMRTAAANTIQCDHNPITGQRLGPHIGPERTNVCRRSADHTQWTVSAATLEADTWTAPDGSTARIWVATTDASAHRLSRTVVSTSVGAALVAYGWYVYIPPGSDVQRLYLRARSIASGNSSGQLGSLGVTGNGASAAISFVSSTPFGTNPPPSITASSVIIQPVAPGVFRLGVVGQVNSDVSGALSSIDLSWSNGTSESSGGTANTRIGVWGWQCEVGDNLSPYIPVPADTAVTRPATTLAIGGAKFSGFYNPAAGTLVSVAQFSAPGASTVICAAGADLTNSIRQRGVGAGVSQSIAVTTSGIDVAAISGPTLVSGTRYRFAAGYSADAFYGAVNGANAGSDTAGAVPTGISSLQLGSAASGNHLNGHLQYIAYYPRNLGLSPIAELSK